MNPEKLQDALNYIDDDLIEEANLRRQKKSSKKYLLTGIVASITAASLIVFVFSIFLIFNDNMNDFPKKSELQNDTLIVESPSETNALTDNKEETVNPDEVPSTTSPPLKNPSATSEADAPMDGEDSYPNEAPDSAPGIGGLPTHTPVMDGDPSYNIQPSITRFYTVIVTVNYVSPFVINCKVIKSEDLYGIDAGENIDIYFNGDTVMENPDILYIKSRLRVTFKLNDKVDFVATKIERCDG